METSVQILVGEFFDGHENILTVAKYSLSLYIILAIQEAEAGEFQV